MNEEAVKETEQTGLVTFHSRSEDFRFKDEDSSHHLKLNQIFVDCNDDHFLQIQ